MDLKRVENIRKNKSRYALWIDLDKKVFHENRKGSIGLFSKRIIGRLLCFMVMNAGKEYNFEELYESVWCLQGNNITEEAVVKTNISRLRELIEPSHKWKYIMKTEPFLGVRGKYYFNPDSNYCMIHPDSFQLFKI